ncbi:hypothetical protein O3G_MSEX003093 [Manduca sexta]|uniref:Uncharacterized protein n=1 Tax=Manduca sexta TaxID=7130 RepID=A0A921YRP5_MANSE|nr:hypothetical protein O3G_MSEX003093 [Manduca sexta]
MCIKYYIYVCMCYCAIASSAEQSKERIIVLKYLTDVNNEGNKSIEIINYDTDNHLTFSCDFENKQPDVASVKLVHQWRGLNISATVVESVRNVTYSIFADVVDHESEVYCIKKIWDLDKMKNNASFIESHRVRLISRSVENNMSKEMNTIYYYESNPAYNICQESGTNKSITYMRKIVDNIVYSISPAKEVSLTPSDSGVIFYCEINNTTYKIPNNVAIYTREILSKTKYVFGEYLPYIYVYDIYIPYISYTYI